VKEIHSEYCKSLKEEIDQDYRRWKVLLCSWIGRFNVMKRTTLSKAIFIFWKSILSREIKFNPHQKSNDIHHRYWRINPKVHMETQKIVNWIGNTEQNEQNWSYHNTQWQTILQRHTQKNSMLLALKQTWRPMEKNRRPRYKFRQICPWFLIKTLKTYKVEDSLFNKCC
jgi:hypothetical protein